MLPQIPPTGNAMKLTKRTIEALRVPEGGREAFAWDSELPGFGVRVHSSGARSFVIQYRKGQRTRRLSLGPFGRHTVDEARKLARGLLAAASTTDADPSAERAEKRRAESVSDLARRYLEEHAATKKKARSAAEDRRILEKYVLPRLGRHRVRDVTRADIARLHHELRGTPIQANRVLVTLSTMFNLAERWGQRPDDSNPCRKIPRYREIARRRYLSGAELARLADVLNTVEAERTEWPSLVPLIRLLILTGARRDEIRTARWDQVDLDKGLLRLTDSKTGAKEIHLNAPARSVIASLPRKDGNPHLIFGRLEGQALVNVKDGWLRIRERAGLPDVTVHDLRHSFAAVAVSNGATLPLIGGLLGHSSPATTARYAHLQSDPLRELNERTGSKIAHMMEGPHAAGAAIVELDAPRRGATKRETAVSSSMAARSRRRIK